VNYNYKGEGDFRSIWNYGLGGDNVDGTSVLEEVRYADEGEYTIILYVIFDGVTSTATTTIRVDDVHNPTHLTDTY